jgi:hypothetical protein
MSTRFQGKNLFKDCGELVLIGTPEMIVPRINNVIKQVNDEGYPSSVHVKIGGAPNFSPAGQVSSYRCVIFGKSAEVGREIGYVELQPLPKEQTLFKLMYLPSYSTFFEHFVSRLLAEFQRLGFIYFEGKKPPIGFKLPHKEQNV